MRHGPAHTVTVVSLSILLGGQSALLHAQATFNMDLLEKNDHLPAVDLQRFNQQAGQPPGAYPVSWQVNGVTLDARKTVTFRQNDRGQLTPCLKPEDLLQAGVNPAVLSQAPGATSRSCPELNALLPGSTVNFDFAHQRLVMTIPQALMTHRARDNVPSALWDEGISAFQSNYRYSGASQRTREGSTERDNYLMLKSGVNVGAWRLRASNSLTANSDDKPQWTTSGAWLERDLTRWQSELTLGDTFTSGDVFDAVQFQGISLASSDAMLPDSQKGFAPTIRGIARTNAQVTVRQNGYVLYQTYVTPGAFVIDDLYPTASSGNLEVAVKESDGEIRRFTQPYASVTSMQREGSLKYNLVAGRYHSDDASQRPLMMQLSLMRGFAHNLTLFGGLQSAAQYHNLSVGAGQGLGEAGALSLQLLNARDRHQQDPIDGRAWQLQYSKGFDRLGTQLTFTGWRYSHQRYATLSEAFSSPGSDDDLQDSDNKKATLQITASQSLPYDITLYLSLDQDSYWSGGATQRTANMGISSQVHGIAWSLSYSDSRSSHGDEEDDEPHSDKVVTLSLSVPLSHLLPGSYAGYTLTSSRHSVGSQMVSLNGTLLDNHALSYAVSQTRDRQNGSNGSLTAGYSSGRGDLNLGYSHDSQAARTLLFILLPAASGWACTPVFVRGQASTLRLNVGQLTVPADARSGTPLYHKSFAWNRLSDGGEQWIRCADDPHGLSPLLLDSLLSGGVTRPTVYQTNLAGIGVRVSLRAIGGYGGFPDRPTPSPFSQRVDNPAALPDAVWKLGYFRLTIELIKTGPAATPGELEYHSERFLMAEHTPLAALDLTGRISTAGCSVNDATPALIKLPAAMLDHFGGVGKTTGDTPFALQLDCNSAVTISLRVDGAEPLTARGHGVLRNDATDDRAQGIGVQLLYHRQPVVLNHEMTLGSASAGRFTLPLTARYYQTRSRITAGQVSAVATYTLHYD